MSGMLFLSFFDHDTMMKDITLPAEKESNA